MYNTIVKILNRKAKFNYQILDKYNAGVVLSGSEVKGIRAGKVDLTNSHVKYIDGEPFLINANISSLEPLRSRKLLLHKKENEKINAEIKAKKLTLVPTKVYTVGRLVKVEIALAKSKKRYQKKETLKKRDIKRQIDAILKSENRSVKF